jgi:hypothetical protein
MKPRLKTPLVDRFWKYVKKTKTCWIWTGAKTVCGGYGAIRSDDGRTVRAHRVSWEIHNGPIPPEMHACHHCDNPPCVRPDHLFLGAPRENSIDKQGKGRARGGSPRGAGHPQAKLTDDKVAEMRLSYASGGTSLNKLAAEYGVSKKAVLMIIHRVTWTHV